MDDNKPRLVPRLTLHSSIVYVLTALCLLSAAAWALTAISEKIIGSRQEALIKHLKDNFADSPGALVKQLCRAQTEYIVITPPEMVRLHQPYAMMSFDPKGFPEEFLKGLVYDVESGCPVYSITVQEDPKTREIHIYNGNDEPILTLARDGYDPLWLVKLIRPETYDSKYTAAYRARVESWLDPARVEIEIKLLPADYIEIYAENTIGSVVDAVASLSKADPVGEMMLMRSPLASSNIVFDAISTVSTGICLVVSYPDDFTNHLEMFVSSNLLDVGWSLLASNLVTAGTNSLTWTDTGATNGADISNRFYRVGNSADSDGDGVADGREVILYHSDPDAVDSDGDGLVDGYSGVVATNAYPAGVATNGSPKVEGELTWGTMPDVKDTDGDAMEDGWEVGHGHNPADANDPPNVSGTLHYSGRQTGTVWVIAVTGSNSWDTTSCSTSSPGASPDSFSYLIPHLEATNYWVKAWVDSNGNGATNAPEARGSLTNLAIVITNRLTGRDITLADPDDDGDSLPDWWEIARFGGTNTTTGSADTDGDEYLNQEEYEADTDPTNNLSHPWNLGGTITYTGPQTGTIHVVACTNATDWAWGHSDTLASPGAYSITHLPPNTSYWIRAWRDSNGDGQPASWEACGYHNSNPVFLDANLTGQDITLSDPDGDGDGIADWWEVRYGLDPTRGGGEDAVAWWKLDEGAGTNVFDATTNAHHGVVLNGSNTWTTGIISNGLSLDGTNAYVEVPDSSPLKPANVSVGLWITPGQLYTNGTAMFLSKRAPAGSYGYSLGYETGAVAFTVCASGVKPLRYVCALTAGVPVHVAGSFGTSTHSLFINGVRVATTNYDWGMGFGTLSQDSSVLRLGSASGATPTNFFAGLLDDVRVYPGEWLTNEVRAIWELGADVDGDGLAAWQEYQAGTSPTNPHDPPGISGTISYPGQQAGIIHVLATTNPTFWVAEHIATLSTPGTYRIVDVPATSYWLKAYRDSNGNGTNESWEAAGICSNFPLVVTGLTTGANVMLADPDTDEDGMPDYVEMRMVNASGTDNVEKVDHLLPGDDFDGDGVSNADEVRLGTDPASSASKPPVLAFTSHQMQVAETISNAIVSVSLQPPAPATVQARLYVAGGTAINGPDYSFTNETITFTAGQTNRDIAVVIQADGIREPAETIMLRLDQLQGPAVYVSNDCVTINITDAFMDSDGDGLPDSWEMQYFGNLSQVATGNPDMDGMDNLAEYQSGGNPTGGAVGDTNNVLRLQTVTPMR